MSASYYQPTNKSNDRQNHNMEEQGLRVRRWMTMRAIGCHRRSDGLQASENAMVTSVHPYPQTGGCKILGGELLRISNRWPFPAARV
ncbi:hypothetical protein Mapa_006623 [Marchantia paleacea]|nr:hypothetical protein Mapa_006623 [Marchantia paleacea]